jgi:hypothetical protein
MESSIQWQRAARAREATARGVARCGCPTLVRAFRGDALSPQKGFVQTVANSR